MQISAVLGTLLVLSATTALAQGDDCRHVADRRISTPAAGITKVVIHGSAGWLNVEGRAVTEVTATGRACTSDGDLLDDITLTTRRSGSALHIEAHLPEKSVIFGFYEARLDFTVILPQTLPVEIEDGSGSLKVTNVASADIEDGSGDIEVRVIRGALRIQDGSGGIDIDRVGGSVRIEDGSGGLAIRNINGNIEIEDGSGEITIVRAAGSVLIEEDGSGSISIGQVKQSVTISDDGSGGVDVADIGGDFILRHKGRGPVSHARVAGRVSVPER